MLKAILKAMLKAMLNEMLKLAVVWGNLGMLEEPSLEPIPKAIMERRPGFSASLLWNQAMAIQRHKAPILTEPSATVSTP